MSLFKPVFISFSVLLILDDYVTSLIIPEELPTILSLIYSNIPPIKKGTDSRLGIGFRLGEHADFQIIVELGPQKYTEAIGNDIESKRKRATMMYAAIKGDLGPWAQAIAKYQVEEKMKRIVDSYKLGIEKLSQGNFHLNTIAKKSEESDWLSKWSQEVNQSNSSVIKETTTKTILPNINRMKVVTSQINSDIYLQQKKFENDSIFLKKIFGSNENETHEVK